MSVPGNHQQGRLLLPSIILLLLISAGGSGWYYFSKQNNKAPQLASTTVQRGNIEDLVTATGTLQPKNYVDVGAQVSGQLHKIHVEVGDEVKTGDLLAEIDPTLFVAKVDANRAQLRYQQAQLRDREAQLELARIQHQRQQNLLAAQATTEESAQNAAVTYQSAQAQILMLQAQIEQTESNLRSDEANLNYAKIYAPMDGTIVSISARQGQTINASQQAPVLMQIADLSTMTVQTKVSEADISRLQLGMEAYFTTLGGREQRWHGTLYRIEPTPTVENNVVLYSALFDVANNDRKLLPQMTAQVFFVIAAEQDTLLIPVTAVSLENSRGQTGRRLAGENNERRRPTGEEDDVKRPALSEPVGKRATVQVINSQMQVEPREIRVGISNRIQMQVLQGLSEGEQVVTSTQGNNRSTGGEQRSAPPGSTPPGTLRLR